MHSFTIGSRYVIAGILVLALAQQGSGNRPIALAAPAPPAVPCAAPPNRAANLITNGDFSRGLEDWREWAERGALHATASGGELRVASSNHNGGLWQRFPTGGAGTPIEIQGFWTSHPTRANAQWSEVLIINGSAMPIDGVDIRDGQDHVELIYKNDSWRSPDGWSDAMCSSYQEGSGGSFVAQGDWATIVLKSGNVGNLGGDGTGTIFRDIVVNRPSGNRPPQASIVSDRLRGEAPLSVRFDARGSVDPDGDPLTFQWSFGDGSPAESGVTVEHTFGDVGSYEVMLTARDTHGAEGTARVSVVVFDDSGGPPSLDTDPGLFWLEDRFERFWGPVPQGWTPWRQGFGDAEWNIVPGEHGWGQELKKTGVRVGLMRGNHGFVAGESFRVKVRAKLWGGFGTPAITIGIEPTGGDNPDDVVWGDAVELHDLDQWIDVDHEFTADGFDATVFLRVDFTDVVDGSVVVDNVSWTRLTPRPPYAWEVNGTPPAEPPYIYGMHDPGAEHLFNVKGRQGWVVHALAIGDDPDDHSGMRFSGWVDGHGCIARISFGFGDTLPHPSRFERFAERAKNFVSSSFGCGIWSIANEPTLERAGGVPITPELYRDAFIPVRNAIKAARPGAQVITAGMVQGDFEFFEQTMLLLEGQTDGIAIHSYTNANYWHEGNFNLYRGLMERIPASMRHLPVYMTEAGNGASGPYPDRNHGFIKLMFRNIHDWNQTTGNQPIRSVNFYRWLNSDQWGIETKPGMIDDFLTAMDEPYYWREP